MECRQKSNLMECTCDSEICERKGICCEFVRRHRSRGQPPDCLRELAG
ncbi:hypothetical protein ES703_37550 [subsurface metagenome]